MSGWSVGWCSHYTPAERIEFKNQTAREAV